MGMRTMVALRVRHGLRLPRAVAAGATIGYACGLASGVFYGLWNVVAKHSISGFDIPPFVFSTLAFAFGTVMFLPLVGLTLPKTVMTARRSAFFFLLSGVASGSAIILMSYALERGEVVVISPIVSISPLITLVIAWVFLRQIERITLPLLFGALLVVGGVILVAVGDTLK